MAPFTRVEFRAVELSTVDQQTSKDSFVVSICWEASLVVGSLQVLLLDLEAALDRSRRAAE